MKFSVSLLTILVYICTGGGDSRTESSSSASGFLDALEASDYEKAAIMCEENVLKLAPSKLSSSISSVLDSLQSFPTNINLLACLTSSKHSGSISRKGANEWGGRLLLTAVSRKHLRLASNILHGSNRLLKEGALASLSTHASQLQQSQQQQQQPRRLGLLHAAISNDIYILDITLNLLKPGRDAYLLHLTRLAQPIMKNLAGPERDALNSSLLALVEGTAIEQGGHNRKGENAFHTVNTSHVRPLANGLSCLLVRIVAEALSSTVSPSLASSTGTASQTDAIRDSSLLAKEASVGRDSSTERGETAASSSSSSSSLLYPASFLWQRDDVGRTPLHMAAAMGCQCCAAALFSSLTKVLSVDVGGGTALLPDSLVNGPPTSNRGGRDAPSFASARHPTAALDVMGRNASRVAADAGFAEMAAWLAALPTSLVTLVGAGPSFFREDNQQLQQHSQSDALHPHPPFRQDALVSPNGEAGEVRSRGFDSNFNRNVLQVDAYSPTGGWYDDGIGSTHSENAPLSNAPLSDTVEAELANSCDFDIADVDRISPRHFYEHYVLGSKPLLLRRSRGGDRHGNDGDNHTSKDAWSLLREAWSRESLLSNWGHIVVRPALIPYAESFSRGTKKSAPQESSSSPYRETAEAATLASYIASAAGDMSYVFESNGAGKRKLKLGATRNAQKSLSLLEEDPTATDSHSGSSRASSIEYFLEATAPTSLPSFLQYNVSFALDTDERICRTETPPSASPPSPVAEAGNVQFYLGRAGTGAPWHFHKDAVNYLAHGQKMWHVLPTQVALYSTAPVQHEALARKSGEVPGLLQCVQNAGDFLFVPRNAAHTVSNLHYSIGYAVELRMIHAAYDTL